MGQESKTENSSFVDIFELDHDKYTDEGSVEEVAVETVSEGHGDVTDVTKQNEEEAAAAEAAEVAENAEDASLEEKGAGKQAEEEEEAGKTASKEDAPDTNDGTQPDSNQAEEVTGVQEMMQSLADNDVLLFDEDSEYEPTEQGLQTLIEETVEKRTQTAFEDLKKSLPEQASALLDVLEKGGTLEDFNAMNSQIDFSKVNVANEKNQGYLVEDWLKLQGYEDADIRERLDDLKSAGLLEKEAKMAQKKLAENQEKSNQERMAKMESDKKAAEELQQKEADEFKERVLNTTSIKDFPISKKKAQKLYDFITNPGEDGKTGFQKMDTEENRLLYAMMAMDGFDKSKLSKAEATKQTIKLKKKLNNFKDQQANPKGSAVRRSTGNNDGGKVNIPWSM